MWGIEDMWGFKSSYFIAGDSHTKIIPLHTAIFNENAILYFLDNVHLLKHYPIKLPQIYFDSFNCPNQAGIQISKFLFALGKAKS